MNEHDSDSDVVVIVVIQTENGNKQLVMKMRRWIWQKKTLHEMWEEKQTTKTKFTKIDENTERKKDADLKLIFKDI